MPDIHMLEYVASRLLELDMKYESCIQWLKNYCKKWSRFSGWTVRMDEGITSIKNLLTFQQMQSMEENRINKIKSMVRQVADIERSVIPIINTCIDGMVKASDGISAEEVTLPNILTNIEDCCMDNTETFVLLKEIKNVIPPLIWAKYWTHSKWQMSAFPNFINIL